MKYALPLWFQKLSAVGIQHSINHILVKANVLVIFVSESIEGLFVSKLTQFLGEK
jgi:hypothetical protein